MARTVDLENMTTKELRELRIRIEAAIGERSKTERLELKAKMERLAEESGLTLEEVLGMGGRGRGGSRGSVAVKYRNPEDPTQTWTGRGRKPNWLTAKMAKRGTVIEDFAV